jgi:hypothetical protein
MPKARKHEKKTVKTKDGYRHTGYFYKPRGKPSRVALVMSHSHTGSWNGGRNRLLREQLIGHLPSNMPVMFMAARAHGLNSSGDKVRLPGLSQRAADIQAHVRRLKKEYPGIKVYVGGVSKGAVESMLSITGIRDNEGSVIRKASRADGLLLFSPGPFRADKHLSNQKKNAKRKESGEFEITNKGGRVHVITPEYAEEYTIIGQNGIRHSAERLPEMPIFFSRGRADRRARPLRDSLNVAFTLHEMPRAGHGETGEYAWRKLATESAKEAAKWLRNEAGKG